MLTLLALSLVAADARPAVAGIGVVGIGVVGPGRLAVTIREGEATRGTLAPYRPQPGDAFLDAPHDNTLVRGGQPVGLVVGPKGRPHLRTMDTFTGSRLPGKVIDDASRWQVFVDGKRRRVTDVARKTFIVEAASQPRNWAELVREHVVTLQLDGLPSDKPFSGTVSVQVAGLLRPDDPVRIDASRTVSPAIHTTGLGFRPDDPGKRAQVSWWSGQVGANPTLATPPVERFELVDADGEVVYRGTAGPPTPVDQVDDHTGLRGRPSGWAGNRSGVAVVPLDFSDYRPTQAITVRVRVPGLGVSEPLTIRPDAYGPAWRLLLQGIQSHRRDVTLDMPLADGTTFRRPAADDAIVTTGRTFDGMDRDRFDGYAKQATGEPSAARGGWMDAGDFDTNHNHALAAAVLADLVARHPQRLGDDDAGVVGPLIESGDGIPDLLNEAMWHVDAYVRMQRTAGDDDGGDDDGRDDDDDGAVPSAVEYAEHPNTMEPSWLNTLAVYETAPSTAASWQLAIAATRVARALRITGHGDRAAPYEQAAARAMRWAESHPKVGKMYGDDESMRVWAAVELLRNEVRVDGVDCEAIVQTQLVDELAKNEWSVRNVAEAEAIASLLDADADRSRPLEKRPREILLRAFITTMRSAYLEGSVERSAFGVLKHGWAPFGYAQGTTPPLGSELILRRYDDVPAELTWDAEANRAAAVGAVAYAMGGNPMNRSYVTGTGLLDGVSKRSVTQLLHIDTRAAGVAAPAGVVAYGTVEPNPKAGDQWPFQWLFVNQQTVHPPMAEWPAYEFLHEYWAWPVEMEYTIWESNAGLLAVTAELDAR